MCVSKPQKSKGNAFQEAHAQHTINTHTHTHYTPKAAAITMCVCVCVCVYFSRGEQLKLTEEKASQASEYEFSKRDQSKVQFELLCICV